MPGRSLLVVGLSLLTLLRLGVAAQMPLSPDEAYYWVWSRALAPGYLDHPPMVALWIRLGTALAGETALGVRLLAPVSAAAGSVLLAWAGGLLFPGRGAGVWAAVLLNATLMLGVGAVTMTPDTPLIFFWTAAAAALARILAGGAGWWWLLVGAAAGLGFDSKYTAVLLGPGIALWLLLPQMRPALRTPWPWAGGALAVALTLPVVAWNAGRGWASFAKQGGRAADREWGRAATFLGELLAGQVGLATPLVFALMLVGLAALLRRWREPAAFLVLALVGPGAALFLEHAAGARVQANWVAILYPGAALAAGLVAARHRGWGRAAAGLGAALTLLAYGQATLAPLPLPRALDPTLRLAGFDVLARGAAGTRPAFLASEEYGLAALLAWHAPGTLVIGAEPRWRLFDLPPAHPDGTGLLLLTTRRAEEPDSAIWASAQPLGTLERGRGTIVAETYRLYRVTLRPGAPAVVLPERSLP